MPCTPAHLQPSRVGLKNHRPTPRSEDTTAARIQSHPKPYARPAKMRPAASSLFSFHQLDAQRPQRAQMSGRAVFGRPPGRNAAPVVRKEESPPLIHEDSSPHPAVL